MAKSSIDYSDKHSESDLDLHTPRSPSPAVIHDNEKQPCSRTLTTIKSHNDHVPTLPDPANLDSPGSRPKPTSQWTTFLTILSDQWFLIAMGLVIVLASQIQVPLPSQHLKETLVAYLTVSIVFFITGCTLDTHILLANYARWRTHLWVQLQSFMLFSALVFGIVSLTALNKSFMDPGLLVGLIFLSCVGTTMSSNVIMTAQAHGNRALTVVQTTVGNFLGVFISPALVVMYTSVPTWYNAVLPPQHGGGGFAGIYRRVLMQLGLSIYLPMFVGQITRYFFERWCKKILVEWKVSKLSSLCMLTILWSTYDSAFASGAFEDVPGSNMIFIVFISIAIWALMFVISFWSSLLWLPKKDVVAVTYVVPAKGTAMGVPLSATMFVGLSLQLQSKIQIPLVIFQGLQIMAGSILIAVFRRWIDNDEKIKADEEAGNTA